MTNTKPHELIDFGNGRKLERFGELIVDRPCPAANNESKSQPKSMWEQADFRFEKESASSKTSWHSLGSQLNENNSQLNFSYGKLGLSLSPAGQLGIFPEQQLNWAWIQECKPLIENQSVLNLFAYTGGSSLAAASVGAKVTHVDAAKNIVQRARNNADISGLSGAPIRWITEDVAKYVARELKRKSVYRAVLLDPPSYGHGPKGESWKIDEDLPLLIEQLAQLIDRERFLFLLTCHSPGYLPIRLQELCQPIIDLRANDCQIESGPMELVDRTGRQLNCGHYLRMTTTN